MRNREAWKTSQMGEFFARGAYEGIGCVMFGK